ncbi:hypothetical protein E7Z59_05200 [Robertkochia marina]|uniref:Aromatic hydrocarbon degradation protein n=1 Tax=Robertkochia marina TaxID=1227945 RepID=A0A4S3M3N1_9FLAO|nr:hypothetical protein [Robertkochia marina]THD69726.1 hypothetical protein E7Z59_05200 [Robertkochia marina]TRZ46931.1 hypothetical protein D3A96_05015 [Robertkochia marina]
MRKKYMYRLFLVLIFMVWCPLRGQDTHYWTNQFGTRSALMSGAVVGGIFDNTMIYYNPGALGFLENTSITVNANAYRFETIVIENALGQQADFKSKKIGSLPLLAGGMINLKNRRLKIGYGFLSPVDFDFKGIARTEGVAEVLNNIDSPGEEEYVGETSISSSLKELMVILGGGYKISDHFSVGLSNIVTARVRSYSRSWSAYVFANNPELRLVGRDAAQNVEYFNFRYSVKLGMFYVRGPWRWGLTLTSPSINLGGEGTTASKVALRNAVIEGRDERITGLGTARQKLTSTFKSPFSAALGVNYRDEHFGFGVAVQYYDAIDIYNVLDPKPGTFIRPAELAPALDGQFALSTPEGAKSVFNVALGYEHFLNERLTLYLSGRTDNSFFNAQTNRMGGIETSISSWDLYHLTGGMTLRKGGSQISFGLLFSGGADDSYIQQGNISIPTEKNLLRDTFYITKAEYSSWGFLIGFTYSFLNAEKKEEAK